MLLTQPKKLKINGRLTKVGLRKGFNQIKQKSMDNKEKTNDKSRRGFLSQFFPIAAKTNNPEMVKMLTADGKLVEVKKSIVGRSNTNKQTFEIPVSQNISSIDNLWGIITKKYQSDNIEDYENGLKKLTQFDLEKHAGEYEIGPDVPREIMIDQLIRLFKMDQMSKKGKLPEIAPITPEMNKELIKIVNS